MFVRRLTALAVGTAASAAVLVVGAPQAAAMSGNCSGGQLTMNTSPIGMNSGPVTSQVSGTLSGCNGTPAEAARFVGDYQGNGSCDGVNGTVNGRLEWENGEVSTVSGPYNVTGGVAPSSSTNTVQITGGPGAGGAFTVTQGSLDPGSLVGPCLSSDARDLTVPLTGVSFA